MRKLMKSLAIAIILGTSLVPFYYSQASHGKHHHKDKHKKHHHEDCCDCWDRDYWGCGDNGDYDGYYDGDWASYSDCDEDWNDDSDCDDNGWGYSGHRRVVVNIGYGSDWDR